MYTVLQSSKVDVNHCRVCGENWILRRRVGWEEMSREMRNMGVGKVGNYSEF